MHCDLTAQREAILVIANPWARASQKCAFTTGQAGYRVYFTRRGKVIYLLLLGGDKSTQQRDIKRAINMASALPEE